jgi:hypothetical protein
MENVSGSASINDALLPVLQEISNAIVVADNLSTISHLMLDLAIRHTGAEKGSLMLVNGQQELYIHSAQGLDYLLSRSYRIKLGEGIAGTVAESGEAVMVADIETDERFRRFGRDRYATRSFISCPIKGMEKVLGVLNINDKRDGTPFTADDFALVRIIAGQAGIALKKSLLVKKFKDKTADLEEANRKLIDADIGRSEFLTRISHELRTPLNAIKGSVYHLQNSGELQPLLQKEFFDIIGRETCKLIAIVEKQLDFLRFEDEDRVLRKSIIYLREILTGICHSRTLRNALSKKNLQLDLDLGEGVFNVVGDKVMVNQLLINLLEGLAHFLDRGSRIVISVRETGSIVARFHVSSRLPEDFLNHHFTFNDLFLNEQSEGAIKIFLARKAAEAHGWQLIGDQQDDFFITLTIPMVKRHRVEAAINATLEMILEFTSELFGANTCSLMLADELSGDLVINCARGLDEEIIRRTRISVPSRIAGWVAQEGKPLLVKDIETDPRFRKRNLDAQYNTKSLLSFPLKVGERMLGVLNLNNKKTGEPFTDRDLRVGTLLIERVTAFVENLYTDSWTDEELGRLLQSLDSLINAERKYPKKDSRLTWLMERLLEQLEVGEEELGVALYISMIYDLGLMLVGSGVLEKMAPLSPLEESSLRAHPYSTLGLLGDFEPSQTVRKVILHHHERYDGTGYPDGLKGEEIPFLSRVLAVVDAYSALTEARPYRSALSGEAALGELRKGAGKQFDPSVVDALERISLDQGGTILMM